MPNEFKLLKGEPRPPSEEELGPIVWKADEEWHDLTKHDQLMPEADWGEWIAGHILTALEKTAASEETTKEKWGWISVEEQLPDKGKFVWVWAKFYGQEKAYLSPHREKAWRSSQNDTALVVTHWRELPAPPVPKGQSTK